MPRFLSHGISVSSAPPMKLFSAEGSGLGLDAPFSKNPFVSVVGFIVGRGKAEAGLATLTMRSRARR